MKKKKKLKKLEDIFRKELETDDYNLSELDFSIVFRGDYKTHIAEIGFFGERGGFAWMQDDGTNTAVIYRAERFLLDHGEEWDSLDEDYEGHAASLMVEALRESEED